MQLKTLIKIYKTKTGDDYQRVKILLADHAARVLPELVEALESLADKNGEFHNWKNGNGESLDEKLNDALSHAKNAQDA
jgi:hypothetical protein